eukprot:CAMPEP_0197702462 /NCGR_PEP_ID=MMETSP1338-20131121/124550_1 /TAXON_ID=43686 ORGANISM="Pelagodinium beii, Strain RCC1491" /NCGR_SAMPLE_ID=MMETSP1338 /ASSEMBLY_ACC=CAM_ASM_000754 /LENGTH=37 /DNA_ID= /DNA_START= /DNA_END= /DNA_ORIENTATION=
MTCALLLTHNSKTCVLIAGRARVLCGSVAARIEKPDG